MGVRVFEVYPFIKVLRRKIAHWSTLIAMKNHIRVRAGFLCISGNDSKGRVLSSLLSYYTSLRWLICFPHVVLDDMGQKVRLGTKKEQ